MNFTPQLLADLGIKLPADAEVELLGHLTENLQERVGLAIFDLLDDSKAEALIALQEHGNEAAIADWVQTNVPDYTEIVEDEYNILVSELADNAQLATA